VEGGSCWRAKIHPVDRRQGSWVEDGLRKLIRRAADKEYLDAYMITHQRILDLSREIYQFELYGHPDNLNQALEHLAELEELSATEAGRDLIDVEEIPRDRQLIQGKLKWNSSAMNWGGSLFQEYSKKHEQILTTYLLCNNQNRPGPQE